MADQLQLRGGPTAQSETFVGAEREITVDTGLKRLRIHDGTTPGGHILSGKVDLDAAVALINQTIDANEAADAQARADLKALLEQEVADLAAIEAADKAALQADIDAEVAASAAYDITQDNRLSVLEAINDVSKKELDFITLLGTASPAAGQVGVTSFTPSAVSMIVLPNTDVNGKTVAAGDFLPDDRIALKQDHGAAAVYFVLDAFTFGDHIRINVNENKTILGAGGDLAFIENNAVSAVFEDTSVTRGAMTAGFSTEATAREAAVASLTALITALQGRADALELDPVTQTYVDNQISGIVNGADGALDTLKEIGDALAAGDTSVVDALTSQITTESTTRAAAITTEETARIAADAATLSSANSYTDSQVASGDATVTSNLTALVTTETNARAAADTALDARIDVVQADVNQNEADSDAAITAEETRALAAEAVLTTAVTAEETRATAAEASITTAQAAEEAARNQLNLHAGLAFGQLYVGDLVVA